MIVIGFLWTAFKDAPQLRERMFEFNGYLPHEENAIRFELGVARVPGPKFRFGLTYGLGGLTMLTLIGWLSAFTASSIATAIVKAHTSLRQWIE